MAKKTLKFDEMLARLEDICGLYIPDEDAVNLQTVGEICTYILNHLEDEHSPEDWNESNE